MTATELKSFLKAKYIMNPDKPITARELIQILSLIEKTNTKPTTIKQ